MGIQFTITFIFLLFEIFLYVLLVIPWPQKMRRSLLHLFTTSKFAQNMQTVQMFLLIFVGILFADSLRAMYQNLEKHEKLEEHEEKESHHHLADDIADQKLHTRIFFAQRNVYLTSFALFVAFAFYRLISILKNLCLAEEKIEKLEAALKVEGKMGTEDKKTK